MGSLYILGAWGVIGLAVVTAVTLLFINAPYGRHHRPGFGPEMGATLGWVVMESPAVLVFIAVFFVGDGAWEPVPLLFLALWQAHYLQRTYIFPFLMRMRGKKSPLLTVVIAVGFNTVNASLNACAVSHVPYFRDETWLLDPRFIIGVVLFVTGYAINRHSDGILRRLRAPGETGYKIPRGGLYRWVSSPNYLGEIVEWCGWALATWSLAGLAFVAFSIANLAPRALAHHRWYLEKFPDYPRDRRALVPWVI